MCGQNAKTNFPVPQNLDAELDENLESIKAKSGSPSSSSENLSQVLPAKLRNSNKAPSSSLTCLRLDIENAHIGVWQKRARPCSDSRWVMTVKFAKKNSNNNNNNNNNEVNMIFKCTLFEDSASGISQERSSGDEHSCSGNNNYHQYRMNMDEEERIALQMIEELLNRNCPDSPSLEIDTARSVVGSLFM